MRTPPFICRLKRFVAAATAVLFFLQSGPLAQAAENSMWSDRRKANHVSRPVGDRTMLASLPVSPTGSSAQILDRLPTLRPSVSLVNQAKPEDARVPTGLEALAAAIPQTHGSIRKTDAVSNAAGTVVILQDIHLNPEAQANIAEILRSLVASGRVGMVGVEGAFTPFDLSWYKAQNASPVVAAVASDALRKNLIAAPSFVGMTAAGALPPFVGVDDPAGYKANVEAYRASSGDQADVAADLRRAIATLASLKAAAYSKDLAALDTAAAGYHAGTVEIGAYIGRVSRYEPALPASLKMFAEASALEKQLDFAKVENERKAVVRKLTESMNETELRDLLARSLAQRTGQIGFAEFYDGLRALCEQKKISMAAAPSFSTYLRYVRLADGIDGEALFRDLAKVEDDIYGRLALTPEAAAISATDRRLRMFSRLADFALTPDEWARFGETRSGWEASVKALPLPEESREEIRELAGRLEPFEAFYTDADVRSHRLVENLLASPVADPSSARVLVLGGFHSPLVASLLRERKIATITVQPKVTVANAGTGTEYLSVFERDNTPLDRLFKGQRLTVAPSMEAVGTADPLARRTDQMLQAVVAVEREVHEGVKAPANVVLSGQTRADGTRTFRAETPDGAVTGVHGTAQADLSHVGGLALEAKVAGATSETAPRTLPDPLTGNQVSDLKVYDAYPLYSLSSNPDERFKASLIRGRERLRAIAQKRAAFKALVDSMQVTAKDDTLEKVTEKREKLKAYVSELFSRPDGLSTLSAGQTTLIVNALRDAEMWDLAARLFEETPHLTFRRSSINNETYLWNLLRLSEVQAQTSLVTSAETIAKATNAAGRFQLSTDKKLSGAFYGRLATVYRKRFELAESVRQAMLAGNLTQDLVDAYRVMFPRDPAPTVGAVADAKVNAGVVINVVNNLLTSHTDFLRGFQEEWSHFPGINALSTAMSILDLASDSTLPADAREMLSSMDAELTVKEMLPLVYESLRAAGGEQSTDYWVHATLLEHSAMEGRLSRLQRFLPSTLALTRRPQQLLSTLGRIRTVLARNLRDPRMTSDADFRAANEYLRDVVVPQMETRLRRLNFTGGDTAPVVAPEFTAENKEIDDLLKATKVLKGRMYDFRGIEANFVGGNVDFGGINHSASLSRTDVEMGTKILEKLSLLGEQDFEKFDAGANWFIARMINLVEPNTLQRWMENLHGDRHEVFDEVVKALREISQAQVSKQSQTNVTADLALSVGDCRQAAAIKQLLYEVWKKSNVELSMSQAWEAIHGLQLKPEFAKRYDERRSRVVLEVMRLGAAADRLNAGESLSEAQWKDVGQRLVDRVDRNYFTAADVPAERLKELAYALELGKGKDLTAADRETLVRFIGEEIADMTLIGQAYTAVLAGMAQKVATGVNERLSKDLRKALLQDAVRQISQTLNWQLAIMDVSVKGQQDMFEKYKEKTVPAGARLVGETTPNAALAGKPVYSPNVQAIEDHTMNGLYRMRKTYVRDSSGRLVQAKIMDRFQLRDSFYQELYRWGALSVSDITTVLKDTKNPEISGGVKPDALYELVGTDDIGPIYREATAEHKDAQELTLQFTKYSISQMAKMTESTDENGTQFRVWGLLAQELDVDSLLSTERRTKVWDTLLWMRDIVEIDKAEKESRATDLVVQAKAGFDRIQSLLETNAPDAALKAEIDSVRALAQKIRDARGMPATSADRALAPVTLSERSATWGLTRFFARAVLNGLIIPLLNRLGVRIAPVAATDVSTRVAPWFETGVTGLVFGVTFAALALGALPGLAALSPLVAGVIAFFVSTAAFSGLHLDSLMASKGSVLGGLARLFGLGMIFQAPTALIGLAVVAFDPTGAVIAIALLSVMAAAWGKASHEAYNSAVEALDRSDRLAAASGRVTVTGTLRNGLARFGSELRLAGRQLLVGQRPVVASLAFLALAIGGAVVGAVPLAVVAVVASGAIAAAKVKTARDAAALRADAEATAKKLVEAFKDGRLSSQEASDIVLNLVGVERVLQRPDRGITPANSLELALQEELAAAARTGALDPEARLRIADLVFQLRYNKAGLANLARPLDLSELPVAPAGPVLFTTWISDGKQGSALIKKILGASTEGAERRSMAVGVDAAEAARIEGELRADPEVRALLDSKRLVLLPGGQNSTVLTFLEQAKEMPSLKGQGRPQIHFLINEGVALPPNFFQLSEAEWATLRQNFVVAFVNRALEAVPMEAGLLTTFQAFRTVMIQA